MCKNRGAPIKLEIKNISASNFVVDLWCNKGKKLTFKIFKIIDFAIKLGKIQFIFIWKTLAVKSEVVKKKSSELDLYYKSRLNIIYDNFEDDVSRFLFKCVI